MANSSSAITKTAVLLVKSLSSRNRDIISRRFGLKTGKKETLESIGQSYSITRERVRQIEEFSLGQLAKVAPSVSDVAKYVSLSKEILSGNGSVMRESEMFKAFSGNDKENVVNSSLVFILTVAGEPSRFGENELFHSFWSLNKQHADSFKESSSKLVGALGKEGKPLTESELASLAEKSTINTRDLNVFLTVSKELGRNVFGEIGLVSSAEVKPKGVRDKAYLVLKKEKEPKHFSEIAKLINITRFSARKANVQTVHNELIKDQRFVLVGRGMYGLSEWGYRPGTVKEVLIDILKGSSKPLIKADLVAKVLGSRMVKENTILLNLQDSKVFSKKEDGTYALRKA
jgi:hypothetical protein